MRTTFLLLILLSSIKVFSQDTVFIDQFNNRYSSLPPNYQIIDTIQTVDSSGTFFASSVGQLAICRNVSIAGKPHSSYFVEYQIKIINNHTQGRAYLDTNNSSTVSTIAPSKLLSFFRLSNYPTGTKYLRGQEHIYNNDIVCVKVDSLLSTDSIFLSSRILHIQTQINIILSTTLEENSKQQFSVYPNPTSNFLSLRGVGIGSYYEIYNINGEKLKSGKTAEHIVINNLPIGVYFLSIPQLKMRLKFLKN